MASASLRSVGLRPGEPMLPAPPRPPEYAPAPWSPTAPVRVMLPSTYLPVVRMWERDRLR